MKTKVCKHCNTDKPLEDFHGVHSIATYCKICTKIRRTSGVYGEKIKAYNNSRVIIRDEDYQKKHSKLQNEKSKTKETHLYTYSVESTAFGEEIMIGITNNPKIRGNHIKYADGYVSNSFKIIDVFSSKNEANIIKSILIEEHGHSPSTKQTKGKVLMQKPLHQTKVQHILTNNKYLL